MTIAIDIRRNARCLLRPRNYVHFCLRRGNVYLRRVLALVLIVLITGCATLPPQLLIRDEHSGLLLRSALPSQSGESDVVPVWPAAPEQPRYRYVGQLVGEQNFQIESPSFLRRAYNWIVGLGSQRYRPRLLQRPQHGFVAADGRIFVTDVSRGAVYVFDGREQKAGAGLHVWEYADEQTRLVTPVGIVAGVTGEVLVADAELGCVIRLDERSGAGRGMICHETLLRPTGLARDAEQGLIYVADSKAHNIKVFSDTGQLLRTLGSRGEGDGEFNGPTYLSFSQGQLYVSDTLNARIQVIDGEGDFIRAIGRRGLYVGDTPRPKGVAVDADANVYIVESYYDYLLIFNDKGEFLLPVGGTGRGIGQFFLPGGVWVEGDRVYVADSFNGRIVIFQYLGRP